MPQMSIFLFIYNIYCKQKCIIKSPDVGNLRSKGAVFLKFLLSLLLYCLYGFIALA